VLVETIVCDQYIKYTTYIGILILPSTTYLPHPTRIRMNCYGYSKMCIFLCAERAQRVVTGHNIWTRVYEYILHIDIIDYWYYSKK